MKILFLTLVLAMMLMSGSALQCNTCYPGPKEKCNPVPDTCKEGYVCVSYEGLNFFFQRNHRKRCATTTECNILKHSIYSMAQCCYTDFCN